MDEREQIIELIQANEEVFEDAFLEKRRQMKKLLKLRSFLALKYQNHMYGF